MVVVDVRHVVVVIVVRAVMRNANIGALTYHGYLRRVKTPESIVCPVLEMALKYI